MKNMNTQAPRPFHFDSNILKLFQLSIPDQERDDIKETIDTYLKANEPEIDPEMVESVVKYQRLVPIIILFQREEESATRPQHFKAWHICASPEEDRRERNAQGKILD